MTKRKALGDVIRHRREGVGMRQDEVATAARALGLRWTRATVAAIELGRREISLSEFITLRGRDVEPAELSALFEPPERRISAAAAADQDAESKAARRLHVEPGAIVAAAKRLWDGRTLTAERDRLVTARMEMERVSAAHWKNLGQKVLARTVQAHRGHVTRALVAQLEQELKGHDGNDTKTRTR